MLYSQYSHRVASKVIANNCMILKNPTKVCSEKCPFTRGEKNICDWISCSWLCFIFQLIELEHNSQREHWFLTSKDPRRGSPCTKVWVFLCLLVYLEESKKIWSADVDFIFNQETAKKTCELLVFTKSEVVTSAPIWWDVSYDEDAWALVSEESTGSLIRRERGGTPCQ